MGQPDGRVSCIDNRSRSSVDDWGGDLCTSDYCTVAAVVSTLALCCCSANPFDPNSPLKQSAVHKFPPDMFFVLRVVQLLRWAELSSADCLVSILSVVKQTSLHDAWGS